METCEICKKEYKSLTSLNKHISCIHKEIKKHEYYDKYILKELESSKCKVCGEPAMFIGFTKGYGEFCPDCSVKNRNFNWRIEHNLVSKEEVNKYREIHKKNSTKMWNKRRENNIPDSHFIPNCIEFWTNKGFSKEESEKKLKEALNKTHSTNVHYRKHEPERFKDTNIMQVGYWVKKGYSEKEAKEIISKRATTFSKEICIEKHGEKEGLEIWADRQKKWLSHKSMKKLKVSMFSAISQQLFWKLFDHFEDEKTLIYFAELNSKKRKDSSGENHEYILRIGNNIFKPDFLYNDKIIEFDGDYWHSPNTNKDRNKNRDILIKNLGYDILHIKEKEYKKDKELTIKKCITFLKVSNSNKINMNYLF